MVGGAAQAASAPTVIDTVAIGGYLGAVAITPDGTRAYITNELGDSVYVIDTSTNTVSAPVSVGDSPNSVAITPDGTSAYVTNYIDGTVSVIDTATNLETATVTVGALPQAVAITPDGTQAYVAFRNTGTISVINTATNAVDVSAQKTLFAPDANGEGSTAIAFTPDGTKAYFTNTGKSTVFVLNTATNAVTTVTGVGQPQGVAITSDGTTAYIPDRYGFLSVMTTSDNSVSATVTLGGTPVGVAISPEGTKAYVVNATLGTVSVIDTGISADPDPATFPSSTRPIMTLSSDFGSQSVVCTGGNPSGLQGTWVTLPAADQCSQTGTDANAGARLLGWSTSPNFPVEMAQSQVDKGWGVIDGSINGVRMIFIPAGMSTFLTSDNSLFAIWSE